MRRVLPGDPALGEVLALIRAAFAAMEGVVDPPSSVQLLDAAAVDGQARKGAILAIGDPVLACCFLVRRGDMLTIGKLAVAEGARGRGLARALVEAAVARANTEGCACVEMQSRVELTGNHAAFRAMGFAEVARTAHPGYGRATSVTFRRDVP